MSVDALWRSRVGRHGRRTRNRPAARRASAASCIAVDESWALDPPHDGVDLVCSAVADVAVAPGGSRWRPPVASVRRSAPGRAGDSSVAIVASSNARRRLSVVPARRAASRSIGVLEAPDAFGDDQLGRRRRPRSVTGAHLHGRPAGPSSSIVDLLQLLGSRLRRPVSAMTCASDQVARLQRLLQIGHVWPSVDRAVSLTTCGPLPRRTLATSTGPSRCGAQRRRHLRSGRRPSHEPIARRLAPRLPG